MSSKRLAEKVGEPNLDRRWTQEIMKLESVRLGELEKQLGASPTCLAISMQTADLTPKKMRILKKGRDK